MITIDYAIRFCGEAERILRPLGWHIGLTGSLLYGHPDTKTHCKNDLDVIIYPHIDDDGTRSWTKPEVLLGELGITDISHIKREECEGYGYVNYIYIGKLADGTKLDALFLK